MMSNKEPSGEDTLLRQILRQWSVNTPLPPHFRAGVWEKIASAEARPMPRPWSLLWGWLNGQLVQPAWAVAYIAILLGLGLAGGYWHGAEKQAQENESLRARYVQSVNPYYPQYSWTTE